MHYVGYYLCFRSRYVVSVGALAGTLSAIQGGFFISSRTAYSMGMDGLLFPSFKKVKKYCFFFDYKLCAFF